MILANSELLFYSNPSDAYTCHHVSLFKLKNSIKNSFNFGLRQLEIQPETGDTVTLFFPTVPELRIWEELLLLTEETIQKIDEGDDTLTIPVFFSDSEYLSLSIKRDTTAKELWWKACEETNIPLGTRSCFFLWTIGRELRMSIISSLNISELFLSEDDVISEIMERWEEAELKFVGGRQSHVKFVLRSTYRLDLEEEKRIGDDTSMSLFFAEGMFHFVNGHYVLPFEDMTTLAAIIAKTKYGDWNSDIQYELVLPYIVPHHFIVNHGSDVIIQSVSEKHKEILDKKKKVSSIRKKFLSIAREQLCYGSTFFRASDEERNRRTVLWQLEQYGSIIIAVNSYGIHILNVVDEVVSSYKYENVIQWAIHDSQYLWFEVERQGEDERNKEMIFKTKFAELIKSYMLELSQSKKRKPWKISSEGGLDSGEELFSDDST